MLLATLIPATREDLTKIVICDERSDRLSRRGLGSVLRLAQAFPIKMFINYVNFFIFFVFYLTNKYIDLIYIDQIHANQLAMKLMYNLP